MVYIPSEGTFTLFESQDHHLPFSVLKQTQNIREETKRPFLPSCQTGYCGMPRGDDSR